MTFQTAYRTHVNDALRASDENKEVKIAGWVQTRRDHGGIIFIDVRDRHGITQIVFDKEFNAEAFKQGDQLRREDVISITGVIKKRGKDLINPKLPTGEVEVFVSSMIVFSQSKTPPFEIEDGVPINEDLRLEYRYLDLRRPSMQKKLQLRNDVAKATREYWHSQGFLEIETPLLIKSTPEGARDYVVPSRVNQGKFYALPQSPQLYKQILMIAGCDRYFQLARCLRDEDLRQDRQPEHTQLDFEMSFASQEDIRRIVEAWYVKIFKDVLNVKIKTPFPIFSFDESMAKFGTDKPDIRFDIFLTDVTEIVKKSDFSVFKTVADSGGIVKAINPPKDIPRKEIDRYIEFCQQHGAKGMAWMRVTKDGLESNIAKYFTKEIQDELIKAVQAKPDSVLMFIADKAHACNDVISRLRLKLGEDLGLIDIKQFAFCWVNDYPLFEWDEEEKRWSPMHHIFSRPKEECIDLLEKDPAKVYADLYDVVLNGSELGSGSIRISSPELQKRVLKVIGMNEAEAEQRFGFLTKAYQYGGPIHGGMGLGFDRLVALMAGTIDIREIIAFPKNKNAQCPMDGAPDVIDQKQLKELGINIASKKN